MDGLKKTHFLTDLTGRVFLTQHRAVQTLCNDATNQFPPSKDEVSL